MHARAAKRMKNALVAAAFNSLAQFGPDNRARRQELYLAATRRFAHGALLLAMHAWHETVRERLDRREACMRTAARRLMHRQASLAFDAWLEFLEVKRTILRRAAYYFGDGLIIRNCFGACSHAQMLIACGLHADYIRMT